MSALTRFLRLEPEPASEWWQLATYNAEVERLAKEERRSLANMVEVLLEQALRLDTELRTKETVKTEPVYVQVQSPTTLRNERRSDDRDVTPDFKK